MTGPADDVLHAIKLCEDVRDWATPTGTKRFVRASKRDTAGVWRAGHSYLLNGGTMRGLYRGDFL